MITSASAGGSAALLAALAVFAACEVGGDHALAPPTDSVAAVVVVPESVTLAPRQRQRFLVFGRTPKGKPVGLVDLLVWRATGGEVTGTGDFIAPDVPGDYTISVTSRRWGVTGSAIVHVAGDRGPALEAVELTPSHVELQPGETRQFIAVGRLTDGSTFPVIVTYSATGGTINSSGLYTAGSTPGTYEVIATEAVTRLADTATVTVMSLTAARAAKVVVEPESSSVPRGRQRVLAATVLDSAGNVLGGRVVTWTSRDPAIAGVYGDGLVEGSAEGLAHIIATSGEVSDTALVLVSAAETGPWQHEPLGFSVISDQPWDAPTSLGWFLQFGTLPQIIPDATAPFSPPNVLQIVFPVGFEGGSAPSTVVRSIANTRDLYVGLWWKTSDPWQGHPNAANKVQYVFTDGNGSMFMSMHGPPGGPYELRSFPQFSTSSDIWLVPNVRNVPVTVGQWHLIEWLMLRNRTANAPNGIVSWWLNGELIGRYTDIKFPAAAFFEYKVAPVWGGGSGLKTELDYFLYDHVRLSGR